MKKSFGSYHYCTHFFDKIISSSVSLNAKSLEGFRIASYLIKELDALQERNPLVTLSFATDSLRVYFSGQLQFHIQARKARAIIWIPWPYSKDLKCEIKEKPELFPIESAFISWVFTLAGVSWLIDYLNNQWRVTNSADEDRVVKHSRNIPGTVRQAVLTDFIASGRWCLGVSGITKKHKISEDKQIEFDHILPHSIGGSNTFWNIQVLCMECNRLKRATAA